MCAKVGLFFELWVLFIIKNVYGGEFRGNDGSEGGVLLLCVEVGCRWAYGGVEGQEMADLGG